MPKQTFTIGDFSGGMNRYSDPLDLIQKKQVPFCVNGHFDTFGKIVYQGDTPSGSDLAIRNDSSNPTIANLDRGIGDILSSDSEALTLAITAADPASDDLSWEDGIYDFKYTVCKDLGNGIIEEGPLQTFRASGSDDGLAIDMSADDLGRFTFTHVGADSDHPDHMNTATYEGKICGRVYYSRQSGQGSSTQVGWIHLCDLILEDFDGSDDVHPRAIGTTGTPANNYIDIEEPPTSASFEMNAGYPHDVGIHNEAADFGGIKSVVDLGMVKYIAATNRHGNNISFTEGGGAYNNDPTITHTADTRIEVGLGVSGSGIPDDAYVGVVTDTTHFELYKDGAEVSTTGGNKTGETLTFNGGSFIYKSLPGQHDVWPTDNWIQMPEVCVNMIGIGNNLCYWSTASFIAFDVIQESIVGHMGGLGLQHYQTAAKCGDAAIWAVGSNTAYTKVYSFNGQLKEIGKSRIQGVNGNSIKFYDDSGWIYFDHISNTYDNVYSTVTDTWFVLNYVAAGEGTSMVYMPTVDFGELGRFKKIYSFTIMGGIGHVDSDTSIVRSVYNEDLTTSLTSSFTAGTFAGSGFNGSITYTASPPVKVKAIQVILNFQEAASSPAFDATRAEIHGVSFSYRMMNAS